MFKDFLNGKYSLGFTYWVGGFGIGIIIKLINRAIQHGFLTLESDLAFARLELFDTIYTCALALYLLLLLRALWKSGHDNRTLGGWGWIGLALTSFAAAITIYSAVSLLFPSIAQPRFMVELELRELNKSLPMDMGDGIVMRKASVVGDDIVFFISLAQEVDEYDLEYITEALRIDTLDGQELCEDFEGYFQGGIKNVVYEYSYVGQIINSTLSGQDCLRWIADN